MLWVETFLNTATPLLIVGAIIWVILTILAATRRRALNLKTAETVSKTNTQPGFLKVDQAKRDAALQGGAAFDEHVANRDAPPLDPAQGKARGLAGKCTVLLAILSLITGAIGALMRVEVYDQAVRKFGVWDNIVETVSNHTVGFVVAMAVIAVAAFNVFRTIQRGTA